MDTNYHKTLGAAIQELFSSYEDYYGIYDTFYQLEKTTDMGRLQVTVGIAPSVEQMGGGKAGTLTATVYIPTWNLESIETARAEIPTIHKAFIAKLHSKVRRQLIHSHTKEL